MLRVACAFGLVVGFGAMSAPASHAQVTRQSPDLVLVDGKVFTSDTAKPWAEAVAIQGERITAVGTTAEIRRLVGPRTRVIDVGGRVVTPGFNDAHEHMSGGNPGADIALGGEAADLSATQVLDSVRVAASRVPPGTWLRGLLWVRAFEDTLLRRTALDRVAPDHPVLLITSWGHGAILNTAAMRALGVPEDVRDAFGGWYERGAGGRLTGRLDEYAGWVIRRRYRALVPESTMVANLRRFAQQELRLGITSVQDMAMNFEPATAARVFGAADLPLRVHLYTLPMPTETSLGIRQWDRVPRRVAGRVIVRGQKWLLDGSPLEGLMFTRGPQMGRPPEWRGRLNFPVDSVRVILGSALRAREQLALHVLGDSAVAIVLSLMESLAPDSAWRPLRVRFEHAGIVAAPDLWQRGIAKGIVVVPNLQLSPPPQVVRLLPKAVVDSMESWRAPIVFRSFPTALGSDATSRSPFVGLYTELSLPFATHPPREMLVRAYTWGSAYAEFAEQEKGTLAPGMLADIAVLSQDIFTVPVDALPRTESVLTIVGGTVVWDAGTLRSAAGRAP